MNSVWPLVSAGLLMGAGGSLHCLSMCAGLQRMTLRGIPVITVKGTAAGTQSFATAPLSAHATQDAASVRLHDSAAIHTSPIGLHTSAAGSATTSAPGHTGNAGSDTTMKAPARARLQLPDGRWWRFQAGRLAGYSLLGLMAGLLGQEVLAAARWQPLFESVWAALNALLVLLGLSLLVLGREPAALARAGSWLASRAPLSAGSRTEWLRGLLWALLPCGLLYTALATAILAATPLGAAAVMAAFALGTNLGLFLMEAGLHSLLAGKRPQLAYRINGLLLVALATAGLVAALGGMDHPYC
ncbi:MAG: sulfite exporter TauE/SafE family protein [Lautropia sp.]|nr:sulfite exporter TauE/SafE family protein [Lautropia sp.]